MDIELALAIGLPLFGLIVVVLLTIVLAQLMAFRRHLLKPVDSITGSVDRLSREIPPRATLEGATQTTEALRRSLTAHGQALAAQTAATTALPEQLSTRVANEVGQGLIPVQQSLDRLTAGVSEQLAELTTQIGDTHGHLINALHTVDSSGGLSEWTASFREALAPFQTATESLQDHFDVARELLRKSEEQSLSTAAVQEATEQALTRISQAVEHWEAIEAANIQSLREEVGRRLEKLEDAIVQVSESIAPLHTANANLASANVKVQEVVQEAMDGMVSLQDRTRELFDAHRRDADALIEEQRKLQGVQRAFHDDVHRSEQAREAQVRRFTEEIDRMTASMANFRKEHDGILKAMERQRDEMLQWMQRVQDQQSILLERTAADLRNSIERLPSARAQSFCNIIQGLQLLLVAVVAVWVIYGIVVAR
jgi:hypothetical protein